MRGEVPSDMSAAGEIERSSLIADLSKGALYCLWQVVRVPALALLVILEPIVSFVLVGIATLTVLVAFFFKFASNVAHFPFWGMLAGAVGCMMLLTIYRGLIALLSH